MAQAYGIQRITYDDSLKAATIEAPPTVIQQLASQVGRDPRLRYVEPLEDMVLDHARNDPLTTAVDPGTGIPWEWWFSAIGVDRALNLSSGSAQILVGVIDSGIAVDAPDLRGKIAERWYNQAITADPIDRRGHGTLVSSIIASNNDDAYGLAGACGACRIVMVKAFDDYGGGIDSFRSAGAIRFATDRGIRILNLSYGGGCSQVEYDAVGYAIQHGVLVVAATGNDGVGSVPCPAAYLQPPGGTPSAGLAVGASDYSGNRAYFSNYGNSVSLVAPGAATVSPSCSNGIFGALPGGGATLGCPSYITGPGGAAYGYSQGTSFSSPMVAGVAALTWATRPDLNYGQIADLLKRSTGVAQWSPDRGWGIVNAARALELATGRSSADPICSDGLDNDGDGLIDFPKDPGCASAQDPDEANAPPKPRDTRSPIVRALPGKYRPGKASDIYYAVSDNSGETRETITIYGPSKRLVRTIRTSFSEGSDGSRFIVTWRPGRSLKGTLKHCVVSEDRAGNVSRSSCASLRPAP